MQFLIFSIICSVAVSILLKLSKKQGIAIDQAVAINYPTAAICTLLLFKPNLSQNIPALLPYWKFLLPLSILMPTVFIIMGECVKQAGIAKSDAAQRLSLFLPIVAAFLIFDETLNAGKIVGVCLAIVSLLALVYKPSNKSQDKNAMLILLGVWLGYGIIDILFKQLSKNSTLTTTYLFTLFIAAGVLMFAYLIARKSKWTKASIVGGLILGCLNFGNIYFYFRAHQAYHNNPTLVFAAMNLGVITLGTIIGTVAFREKINRINMLGIALAMIAIVCLFYMK
ncbi:MAG: EamA/RhaT family transporter [Neisseriaceae bacterium]|nr:EamA/RhaT family transporter [Neisseriaceae bacterium]